MSYDGLRSYKGVNRPVDSNDFKIGLRNFQREVDEIKRKKEKETSNDKHNR